MKLSIPSTLASFGAGGKTTSGPSCSWTVDGGRKWRRGAVEIGDAGWVKDSNKSVGIAIEPSRRGDQSGRRQTVRLGSVFKKIAETTKCRVEEILAARFSGTSIQPETASSLAAIAEVVHERLAKVGLVEPRQTPETAGQTSVSLGKIVCRYIESRSRLKPNTLRNYETTRRLIQEHFGKDRLVRSIHAGHAKDYREWLVGKYATATVAREIKRARQFFEYAKDCHAIEENPFLKVKAGSQKNSRRKQFVCRELIEKVLAACPDNDWRLVVVLTRYGGLRIPSELERLTWDDVDWAGQRFTVRVKKKEHIDGHERRVVPIFSEIEPYLRLLEPSVVNRNSRIPRVCERYGCTVWQKYPHGESKELYFPAEKGSRHHYPHATRHTQRRLISSSSSAFSLV